MMPHLGGNGPLIGFYTHHKAGSMQDCPTLDEIRRFARGESPPDTARRVRAHVRDCPHCRNLLGDGAAGSAERGAKPPTPGINPQAETVALPRTAPVNPNLTETEPAPAGAPTRTHGDVFWSLDARADATGATRDYLPHIDGYEVKRVLGRGGMGVVYEAVQTKLRRRVALKLLPAVVGSQHPDLVARFQREATAAARLHHSNIIPIYDYGESRDGYYYAMELILGESLSSVIRRLAAIQTPLTARTSVSLSLSSDIVGIDDTPQPVEREVLALGAGGVPYYRQVAEWIASIADALDYAHQHGMIHRDIKPGNLMLASDGRVIILDFGLVKTEGDTSVTVSGSTVGTYRYISPEQISPMDVDHRGEVDARCDQYALGVTMYELLVLHPAFPESDQRALLHAVLHRDPTSPRRIVPSIPRELEVICLKAIEKSPKNRYATCADLAADVRRFLADVPIQARPAGPVRRAVKFVKRHRAASLTALTALLLATSIGFGAWQREKAHRLRIDTLLRGGIDAWRLERNWRKAESKFQEVLTADPTNFRALVNFAAARKDQYFTDPQGTYLNEAVMLLDRALQTEPERPEIWNFKGVVLREQGKLTEALAAHQQSAKLEEEQEKLKQAKGPTEPDAARGFTWVNLATVRALQGDLEQAEKDLLHGIELKAGDSGPKAWYNLAAVQLQLGRSEAERTIVIAIDHPPEKVDDLWRPASYLLRAKLHLLRGTPEDDLAGLRAVYAADQLCGVFERRKPENIIEKLVLARTKRFLALAELRAGRYAEAIVAAQVAKSFDDLPAYADLIMAGAYAKLGQTSAADAQYKIALAGWPERLKHEEYVVRAEGAILWFDSAAELDSLRTAAEEAVRSE